ncbi:MAG: Rpn family recombination-promoting nuclease/putative transposase [Sandaracinaceae bacterium]|nr:Rpn family recombination-promoting nuclease/putative transposase [Sandaracinaceae bacterium]MBK7774689.1 Rpn family recombination-promoting nuclease/putative transposase [Sandaracinaceae bacterium]MBK8410782.1 Rpn family recombination-promoting nuclease/putative transposase [Sandaracinaceae bacterium]
MGEHDTLFKRVFSVPEYAAAELASVLPRTLVSAVDLSQLVLVNGSFVDETMQHRHADLLFRAPRRRSRSRGARKGRRRGGQAKMVYFYFLFEHLSRTDALAAFRLLQYMERIWAQLLREDPTLETLPLIVPLVVHHGAGGWRGPRSLHEMIEGVDEFPALRPFVPNLELLIDDLALHTDGELQQRPMPPVPKLATWLLRDGRDVRELLRHVPAWGADLEHVARAQPGELVALLGYILLVAGVESLQAVRDTIVLHAPSTEASMISIADHLIEQGRELGDLNALRRVLRLQLTSRFGPLSAEFETRLNAADSERLELAVSRVLTAAHPADVLPSD